jgi:hypothetical protein
MNIDPSDAALLATQLAMGFALAATVGLRTFLPLLAAGLLARFGYVDLGDHFEWMARTPALIVFGSAVVFESSPTRCRASIMRCTWWSRS